MTDKTPTFCELTLNQISDSSNQGIQIWQIVAELHWSKNNEHFISLYCIFMPVKSWWKIRYLPLPCHQGDILSFNMYSTYNKIYNSRVCTLYADSYPLPSRGLMALFLCGSSDRLGKSDLQSWQSSMSVFQAGFALGKSPIRFLWNIIDK